MKVMVLVKATAASESGQMPGRELLAAMSQYNESLVKAGVLLAAEGLKPSRAGKRVRFTGESRHVTDGPFAEIKALVAGFWLWQVRSVEEAVEWVKRCPSLPADSELEIRPVLEESDFGPALTPELAAAERSQRERSAAQR